MIKIIVVNDSTSESQHDFTASPSNLNADILTIKCSHRTLMWTYITMHFKYTFSHAYFHRSNSRKEFQGVEAFARSSSC